jgi:hypothetical protein
MPKKSSGPSSRGRTPHIQAERLPAEAPPDPQPRQAYILGYDSHAIWHDYQLLWRETDWIAQLGAKFDVTLQRLFDARVALADAIHVNVFNELSRVIDDLVKMGGDVEVEDIEKRRKWVADHLGPRLAGFIKPRSPNPPGIGVWRRLRTLVDQAFVAGSHLGRWYRFGSALGSYRLELYDLSANAVVNTADSANWPGIGQIIRAARSLPNQDIARISALDSMIRLVPLFESHGQSAYIREYLAVSDWMHCKQTSKSHSLPITTTMPELVDSLNDEIHKAFRRFPHGPETAQGPPPQDLPEWDKENLRLLWKGEVVRKVKFDGEDIILILDSFHELGWPRRSLNPLPGFPENRVPKLESAIDSLNSKLKMLRFHTEKKCTEIWWEPIQPD